MKSLALAIAFCLLLPHARCSAQDGPQAADHAALRKLKTT